MPRQARLDSPGTLHHVMIRGIEGGRIFHDDEDRGNFLGRVGQVVERTGTRIVAWVLMDNHVHLLLFSGPAGVSTFMRRLLTGYAVWFNRRHQRFGHLFQNRYKSIVCEEDSSFFLFRFPICLANLSSASRIIARTKSPPPKIRGSCSIFSPLARTDNTLDQPPRLRINPPPVKSARLPKPFPSSIYLR